MTTPTSRYAPPAWGGSPFTELEVPSGGKCLVRKLQPMDLASGNFLGASDLLAQTVSDQIENAKRPKDHLKPKAEQKKEDDERVLTALSTALSKPEALDSMVDKVVCQAVVEPRIEMPPAEVSERENNVVYVDTVPFSDKMVIFNWVMRGIDGVKAFRGEPADDVEAVETGEGVPHPTE